MQWLGLGDRNSRFFHKVTQSRNVRNTIRRIVTEDGRILTSPSDIKLEGAAHFENFLNGSPPLTSDVSPDYISDLVDYRCSNEDRVILTKPVEASKIKEVRFPCLQTKRWDLMGTQ